MKTILVLLTMITLPGAYAQDWPNLKKYESANASIHSSGDYPSVVFMGNSITEGWFQQRPEFFKKHGFEGRGIGGQTTPQMLIRFTPDVIDLQPEVVVILAGTNDIAGNTGPSTVKMITDNIAAMAMLSKAHGIKVVISSILPVKEYPWSGEVNAVENIAAVNHWMKEYAREQGFVYLDYFSAMVDEHQGLPKIYSEDGVHPNQKGYEVMEPMVLKAIEKAREKGQAE